MAIYHGMYHVWWGWLYNVYASRKLLDIAWYSIKKKLTEAG
jgi:hypothetical protein